jgi:uncharacterized protein (TIGR02266 family)
MAREKNGGDKDNLAPVSGRRDTRIVVNREFKSIEEFIYEYVVNISRTGAFIRSRDPLPVGTKVRLEFTVISDELETIRGLGEVVRVVPPGRKDSAGMGVVFTRLTSVSKRLLDALLSRKAPPPPRRKER